MRGSPSITSGSFYVSSKIPAPRQKQTISPPASDSSSPKSFISYDGPNTPPGGLVEHPFYCNPPYSPQNLATVLEETNSSGSYGEVYNNQFDRVLPFPPPFTQTTQQAHGPALNYRPPFAPRLNHHHLTCLSPPGSPLASPLTSPMPSPPKQAYSPFSPPRFLSPEYNKSPQYTEHAFFQRPMSPSNNLYSLNSMMLGVNFGSDLSLFESPP